MINTEKYNIDVFAMEHFGPYSELFTNCTILVKRKWLHALIAQYKDVRGAMKFRCLAIKILRNFLSLIKFNLTDFIFKETVSRISKDKYFDTVIAFSEGVPTAFVRHFKSPNKIAWVRCDYSRYVELNNCPDESIIYNTFKSIVCVSNYTKDVFCRHFPKLSNRVYSIHNILDTNEFLNKSKSNIIENLFNDNQFNIISIGRIDPVKRFSKIPQIARTLIDRGYDFRWFLIGPGTQSNEQLELQKNIKKYEVEKYFYWLGIKNNPYPYIAQSDLLVSLSISEACPNVINEAKVLHTPVVCTNFGSATEFIDNGNDGFITPLEEIADKIELLLQNGIVYEKIKSNILKFKYDNASILKQLYGLLE